MRCPACGQLLADEAKSCPSCGAVIEGRPVQEEVRSLEDENFAGQQSVNDYAEYNRAGDGQSVQERPFESGRSYTTYDRPYEHQPAMPMKWYKFLIYVSLFLSGISNIFMGVQAITGMQYGDAVSASQVYSMYSGLKIVDVVYGAALVAIGVYAFIVRSKLAHYRTGAPKHLLLLYALAFIMNLVYVAGASLAIGMNLMSADVVMSLIVSIIMLIANKVYFDKRAHLFNT